MGSCNPIPENGQKSIPPLPLLETGEKQVVNSISVVQGLTGGNFGSMMNQTGTQYLMLEERTMEKKTIAALIVTGAIVLGLSACGTNGATSDNADNSKPDTSTPVVTEPADTSAPGTEQTTPDTSKTTPESIDNASVSQTETEQETQPTAQEENPVVEEVGPKFTEVNETVYATTSVNVRASCSADSDKVGGLSAGASATRTGIGDNGWSRIVYGDSVAYVSSDYLTTTKPSTGSSQTSKPNTGGNTTSGGNTSIGGQTTTPTTPPDSGSQTPTPPADNWTEQDQKEWEEAIEGVGGYYDDEWGVIIPNAVT